MVMNVTMRTADGLAGFVSHNLSVGTDMGEYMTGDVSHDLTGCTDMDEFMTVVDLHNLSIGTKVQDLCPLTLSLPWRNTG